ncbi:MAG: hypothetical protein ACTHNW_07310 [Mucilaginibacter sp.]
MGNLLTRNSCFVWTDKIIDRSQAINDLNDTLKSARAEGDKIFRTPNFHETGWNCLFEDLWTTGNFPSFKALYPWIKPTSYQTLIQIFPLLGKPTPEGAAGWTSFNAELPSPKSMIGFHQDPCPDPLVYNEPTWKAFHGQYVKTLSYAERSKQFKYFKKFFIPDLTQTAAQINDDIDRGRYKKVFERIDNPPLNAGVPAHEQQIHVHFTKVSKKKIALNIDGTWKHPDDKYAMSVKVKEILSAWGFLLPDDHY